MLIYEDKVTGKELCSDSYKTEMIMDGAVMKVEGKYVVKGNVDAMFEGADELDAAGEEKVINIVDAHGLVKIDADMSMAMYKGFLKGYIKGLKGKDGVDMDRFKTGVTQLTAWLGENMKNCDFYHGEDDFECNGMVIVCSFEGDDGTTPCFYYLIDGVTAIK